MSRRGPLKIGNAGGYWGDDPTALKRQVEKGHLDYISMDFLAEITMSILKKQHATDPKLGYAHDFIPMLAEVLPAVLKNKTRIITNAGGINPKACAQAIEDLAARLGLRPTIAVVFGDDIMPQIGALQQAGHAFVNMENGASFPSVADRIMAANVYFGAIPVLRALQKWQPDIIITGRVTDTGITLAPLMYEFGWAEDDWDKLAAGIVAGHMIECGSQITGGNFTDWRTIKDFHEIGYPVVEANADGSFVLTKHTGTGGLVSVDTVREQLFYEMGRPDCYITPDVVADFSTIRLAPDGRDRVHVSGVKGLAPTPTYKVSMAYSDGNKCIGTILISGPDARAKAETFASIFWDRCGKDFDETMTEYLGWNACHRSLGHVDEGAEILLRLGVRSSDDGKLKAFGKWIPSLILGGPPGVAVMGGVPKKQSIVSYWPALLPKTAVSPSIARFDAGVFQDLTVVPQVGGVPLKASSTDATVQVAKKANEAVSTALAQDPAGLPLSTICLARSGDKGDMANIGILARGPRSFAFLKEYLTAQRVKNLFQELCYGSVTRYTVEGMLGLNFLLDESLGGGGSETLRSDAQGKTFSQALLRQKVRIPHELLDEVRG